MTSADFDQSSGTDSIARDPTATEREPASNLLERVRRSLSSGVFASLGGSLVLWSGLRALRRGQWGRSIVRLLVGSLLISVGVRQRRSRGGRGGQSTDVDQQDVVDTSPDIETVDEAGIGEDDAASAEAGHAGGEEAQEVAGSSIDIEDARQESGEAEMDDDEGATTGDEAGDDEAGAADDETDVLVDFESEADEPEDRIGEGAFDEREGVPVPERAIDEGFLQVEADAFWGIRDRDDAVFVSRSEAVFEEADGVEYVTSSDVDESQLLSVPGVVLDHWEGVAGDEPMTDADELVFATSDDLRQVEVLWIVPEYQADEWFEQ